MQASKYAPFYHKPTKYSCPTCHKPLPRKGSRDRNKHQPPYYCLNCRLKTRDPRIEKPAELTRPLGKVKKWSQNRNQVPKTNEAKDTTEKGQWAK